MTNYLPHQQRVLSEKEDLDVKVEKLGAFTVTPTFKALDRSERGLLHDQLAVMSTYSEILGKRIATFRCGHCDGTGDVHSIDGEWRGACSCEAGQPAKP